MSIRYNKKDFLALQNLWNVCALRYLGSISKEERVIIIDDFRETLIDIRPDGDQAIRKNYDDWEKNEWIPYCNAILNGWIKNNSFEAKIEANKENERDIIKQENNYIRYHKILQLIQNSGIGLGQGKQVKTIERPGYQDE
jgi:hypothetical protein